MMSWLHGLCSPEDDGAKSIMVVFNQLRHRFKLFILFAHRKILRHGELFCSLP